MAGIAWFSMCFNSVCAGDILRGGASQGQPSRAVSASNASGPAAQQARAHANDALSRTTQALQAVRAMQAAARARSAALPNAGPDPNHPGQMLPNVPNGLVPGGLQPAAGWVGANAPTQSSGGRGVRVNIKQTQQQALLNWTTFNVGSGTTLNFDQSAGGASVGQWIAFNKVNDPSGVPSQILGSITAQGQVYIINQNGIIFGAGSQVNTHALVASSLPINENLITRGLLNNPDAQFLFSALALPAGAKGTPAFTPPPLPANGKTGPNGELQNGDVTVQAGAVITAPTSAGHVGGRVMLVGPNVTNAGTIFTPDGQTILAAGLQVGFDAHKSSDPSLRGLDTYVGAIANPASANPPYAGTATNRGLIEAPRGNVTIAGKTVNQSGAINSSTSVSLNGRIDLNASYNAVSNLAYDPVTLPDVPPFFFRAAGVVTLGPGSVTQITPETTSADKVIGTQLALRSQVNVRALAVHLAPNAMMLAPNAVVGISAGVWDYVVNGSTQRSTFVYSGGQIYLDKGSFINVAGSTGATAPMSQNILTVQLRGAELADRPLQRGGLLRGPDVTVDIRRTGIFNGFAWVGTPLADLSGYVGLIERTVGELTSAGGTVNLRAGGSVVIQQGATVDVSGGYINYEGGMVKTTRVMYAGHIFDIADALPDKLYEGIYTGQFTSSHTRWGVTNTYQVPFMTGEHWEPGYIHGAAGGRIEIQAPAMALDGTLLGHTIDGPRQRAHPAPASTLALSFKAQQLLAPTYPFFSPTPPNVVFEEEPDEAPPADAFVLDAAGKPLGLRADRSSRVTLSTSLLTASGFGNLSVENPDGDISVPEGVNVITPALGSVTLSAANINIRGSITSPSGSVSLTAYNISPTVVDVLSRTAGAQTPPPSANRGNINLGTGAVLSAAGLIVDDRLNAAAPLSMPLATAGGSVSIAAYNVTLEEGSVIDVSGGVAIGALGARSYGNGGSITIKSGQDVSIPSVLGGKLELGAVLKGFSGALGGSISIQAPRIQIGGSADTSDVLLLSPEFFSEGGFSSFTLTGLGDTTDTPDEYLPGVVIAPGTVIKPVAQSVLAVTNNPGAPDGVMMVPILKPVGLRSPVSLTFRAPGVRDQYTGLLVIRGDIVMGEGARIETDPLGSVTFTGDTVAILGSVIAPGGSITITGGSSFPSLDPAPLLPLPTVHIGPRAHLSTAGTTVLLPDRWGNRTGFVLPGGTITVAGNIVAEAGAMLDVSGTSGILDLPPAYLNLSARLLGIETSQPLVPITSGLNSPLYQSLGIPTRVDSNAGTIILRGGQELFVDATLLGNAGGPTALGGTLIVSSGRFYPPGVNATPADINLVVTQDGPTIPNRSFYTGATAIGQPVLGANGVPVQGMGYFSANTFSRGGFDALALGGNVQFSGPITINARRALAVASGGVIAADSVVNLTAPYVALGMSFRVPLQPQQVENQPFTLGGQPFFVPPSFGPGVLNVSAELIDIGNLSLQNIGKVNLIADGGDVRGNGTFVMAGDLLIRAGQVYPTTMGTFTLVAYDGAAGPGSITFERSGDRPLPLSAGGQLNVYAGIIRQGGVLRAPMGSINLGWDGSGTPPLDPVTGQAVPVTQTLTLAPGSITSVAAVDPRTGLGILIPFGVNPTGNAWIDPSGVDITAGGVPSKGINISAQNVAMMDGAVLDLSGGGDLYAYRWIQGNGGTTDVLASSNSFAVIPGYGFNYMPFAPFNNTSFGGNLGGDPGYVNGGLQVGDQIYLGASAGLPAGVYTLLPARYALMPGAFLVTPQSGAPIGTFAMPDGASLVSGYRYNSLNGDREIPGIYSRFEVAPGSVVRARSEYEDFFANSFLREGALALDFQVPRLPMDGGHLVFQATQSMVLAGTVFAQGGPGGRGGLVDISSPVDILITGPGVASTPGTLTLDATKLSGWGAESLLIGGVRTIGANGTTITVGTGNLTVDNAGTPLTGPEIILVANESLTLAAGALVIQQGSIAGPADTLILGTAAVPGSGNGTLLRVTSDFNAQIIRQGVSVSNVPNVTIGDGATISGVSLTLDSTSGMTLSPNAILRGDAISLNAGQISLVFDLSLPASNGLVLTGPVLQGLQSVQSLSLLSYSSLDTYGAGSFSTQGTLALHAAQIRGFNTLGGAVNLSARNITIDNRANGTVLAGVGVPNGQLTLTADTITLGSNLVRVDRFSQVTLNAASGLFLSGTGGLRTQAALTANTPFIAARGTATQTLTAGGALVLQSAGGASAPTNAGLGASLSITGASVTANTNIYLPSGTLDVRATTGNITVGGVLGLGGTAQNLYDVVRYTDGGKVTLTAQNGSVTLNAGSVVTVAAQAGGGDAGSVSVSAANGSFTSLGTLLGSGGTGGEEGSFSLDTGALASYATLNGILNAGSFNQSRTLRIRNGNVTVSGTSTAHHFNLSVDNGSITVTGTIDASGVTGGSIALQAGGALTLAAGSQLMVAAQEFNNAGKGGAVTLETRGNGGAMLDLQAGSTIDLSVAATASLGQFTGTLHLRAPQNAAGTNLQVNPINGTIVDASSIIVEGFRVFDLSAAGGSTINAAVRGQVNSNATAFVNAMYATPNFNGLLPGAPQFDTSVFSVRPGAEIINPLGSLTVGNVGAVADDWNLATFRYGPDNVPGVLTLRAAGDLIFANALSDGFNSASYTATLMAPNANLPLNAQSWSYRLVAGADMTAVDFRQVRPLTSLAANVGSVLIGRNSVNISNPFGPNAQTSTAVAGNFQVIRTGSGDIDIAAGRDVQLLNHFATIYTAGTLIADPTMGGTFDVPILNAQGGTATLGAVQQNPGYPAQYTLGGGNITIHAQANIAHLTRDVMNVLVADSQRQLPMNWLYRRGYVDPATGQFGVARFGDEASTTWWVDFANFFQGVGALGGGNVTMTAGGSVTNVDAVAPTNARMPSGTPDASGLVELGGGDVIVRAGQDIDGGVYYVERGRGILEAGNTIRTNSTRSPSVTSITNAPPLDPATWLPTTLFLGKATFDVKARGDVLMGPVANPFLLPGGYNNTFWYKSYFSTYGQDSGVSVSSLAGDVTFRTNTTMPTLGQGTSSSILHAWIENVLMFNPTTQTPSFYQPWLRLNEDNVAAFRTVSGLMPGTLRGTAFSGDINLVGDLTLSPSSRGTVELLAGGAINGLQPNGRTTILGVPTTAWSASQINLSDANPASIPGIISPFAYQTIAGTLVTQASTSGNDFLAFVDNLFEETGSTIGAAAVIQNKQALHAPGPLHLGDRSPVRLYAQTGDISGLTLFAGKASRVIAGHDVSDVALYIQNLHEDDISLVASGRDIIPYNANTPSRVASLTFGNALTFGETPQAGDIQISGPGVLEVLAGRDLDLGIGANNADGTGVGITSIGNGRNPFLSFEGATIIAGAGIGGSTGLASSSLDFDNFITEVIEGPEGTRYLTELGAMSSSGELITPENFDQLSEEEQARVALAVFYIVLRDAGRDHNVAGSPGFGNYDAGFAAIDTLFANAQEGDILTRSRDIRTKSGGDIMLFAPGGSLTLATSTIGAPLTPPGIITEAGGSIGIFTNGSVNIGISRIFTLRGGDEVIWSSTGDIAAGSSSKTVQSAPPTRVVIDPQSGDVTTDLAGLATGGGIGVLATVEGVPPGNVDLIAPMGVVDAGDAGIRATGNLNIAATAVLNASNISVGGASAGTPSAPAVAAPNIGGLTAASNTAAASSNAASETMKPAQNDSTATEVPSIITVEVLGYGGGGAAEEEDEDEEEKRRKKAAEEGTSTSAVPPQ